MAKKKSVFSLFWDFLKFGCFTFGGGWSIVAQMYSQYVDREQYIESTELMDITSVGRSLPGAMICNIAMLFGYHCAGTIGGFACVLGMSLPPLAIICLITYFYTAFQSSLWVMAAMQGIRAAVVPIIVCAVIRMLKGSFKFPPCFAVALIAFALYFFFNASCALLVIMGLVLGIAISEFYERRGGGADGAA